MKKTLILGASENPERYSNKAILSLEKHHVPVVAIGARVGTVGHTEIQTGMPTQENIHTISLYLSPKNQEPYYSYIINMKPKRILFNPGTENAELAALASLKGIQVEEACTLVLLSIGNY